MRKCSAAVHDHLDQHRIQMRDSDSYVILEMKHNNDNFNCSCQV